MNYFLMKAEPLNPKKLISGVTKWSIKLDGMRAFWDGGITRGAEDVPWCIGKRATGLWSINANIIYAPDWWLDKLSVGKFVDGELWGGVGNFQEVISTCTRHVPDDRWKNISLRVFEPLAPRDVYKMRVINQKTCHLTINSVVRDYMQSKCNDLGVSWSEIPHVQTIEQYPFKTLEDIPLDALLEQGHEGIMFRNPSHWEPIRSWGLMKLKPFFDDEALVIGHTGGDHSYTGKIGALIVKWYDKIFKISIGLNFAERECNDPGTCSNYVGRQLPIEVQSLLIPTGSVITFKYRELTVDGIPKEARYWRTLA